MSPPWRYTTPAAICLPTPDPPSIPKPVQSRDFLTTVLLRARIRPQSRHGTCTIATGRQDEYAGGVAPGARPVRDECCPPGGVLHIPITGMIRELKPSRMVPRD